jgi:hypothetical protein
MGAKTIRGIRFNVYSNDHDPPHVDAEVDGMKMKIFFGTETEPPRVGPTNPRIKDNAVKRAYKIFVDNEPALKEFYEEERAKASK